MTAPQWVGTQEAAKILGIGRGELDRLAPAAALRRPDLVVQVGVGTQRRRYRWLTSGLGDALAAGRQTLEAGVPSSPARAPAPRARVAASASRSGTTINLRALLREP